MNTVKKKKPIRLTEIYFCIALLCLMGGGMVLAIIWFDEKPKLEMLRSQGKEVTALVWEKKQGGYDCGRAARRRTCTSHILSVRYHVGGKTRTWDLGKVKLEMPVIGSGTTHTKELSVSLERYEASQLGDKVRLVYSPSNPRVAEEADWVRNWSPWPTLAFCVAALLLAVVFAVLTVRRYRWERQHLST